ncbi:MAG: Brp/Blh family beta-carotene 15,15'-dioxygenase, partial [Limisphaerales bacterium]
MSQTSPIPLLSLIGTAGIASHYLLLDNTVVLLPLVIAMIAFAGLPHGAADLWIATARLGGKEALTRFGVLYSAIAVAVVAAWFFLPMFCTISFLLISWWHFGGLDGERSEGWAGGTIEGAIP